MRCQSSFKFPAHELNFGLGFSLQFMSESLLISETSGKLAGVLYLTIRIHVACNGVNTHKNSTISTKFEEEACRKLPS